MPCITARRNRTSGTVSFQGDAEVRRWYDDEQSNSRSPRILDVVSQSGGKLNFNDAALVALQREGVIDEVASFDATLAAYPGFRSIA